MDRYGSATAARSGKLGAVRVLRPLALTLLAACGSLAYYDPDGDGGRGPRETGELTDTVPIGDDDDDDDTIPTGPSSEDCLAVGDEDADGDADCADPDCATTCDADDDGHLRRDLGGDDCDDGDPGVHPGVFDDCDGVDDDCSDTVDDGDGDTDGADACDDCDDADASRHPGAVDTCDGVDSDCDAEDCVGFGDGFEAGSFGPEWVRGGDRGFFVTDVDVHSGTWSARSYNIGDGSTSTLEITLTFATDGAITFWHTGDTEACCDKLRIHQDGTMLGVWSGSWAWTETTYPVTAGVHTFVWRYSKDGSESHGTDRVFVDDIFAANGVP